jgi:hypothetical protein
MARQAVNNRWSIWLASFLSLSIASASSAEEHTRQVIEATCKVTGANSTATAWLVKDDEGDDGGSKQVYLVTAAHVFDTMQGEDATLVAREKAKEGMLGRHDVRFKIRRAGKNLWSTAANADIAVIPFTLPDDVFINPLSIQSLATEKQIEERKIGVGEDLRLAGFPQQNEANGAGLPIVRRACIASHPFIPLASHRIFLVDYNCFAGDSGGPIFLPAPPGADPADSKPLVIGLVTGQRFIDERTKTLFEEKLERIRLGIGIAIHAEFVRQAIGVAKGKK